MENLHKKAPKLIDNTKELKILKQLAERELKGKGTKTMAEFQRKSIGMKILKRIKLLEK